MTSGVVVFGILVVLVVALWKLTQQSRSTTATPDESQQRKFHADLDAFLALTDPSEELYLRISLSRKQFRSLQRKRIILARQCLKNVGHNANVFARIGAAARLSTDPEIVLAGKQLLTEALQVRMNARAAEYYLLLRWLLPAGTPIRLMRLDIYHRALSRVEFVSSKAGLISAHRTMPD
jgi:hypothetical protein